jgi:hypothetical protein
MNSADMMGGGGSGDMAGGGGDMAGSPSGSSLALLAGQPGGDGEADGTGALARFSALQGIAGDGAGNLYVAGMNTSNGLHTIRKIVAATGVVTTLNLPASNAITDLASDGAGSFYGSASISIVKLLPSTSMETLIAGGSFAGSADGVGSAARFSSAAGMAWDGTNLNGDFESAYISWLTTPCRSCPHEHAIRSAGRPASKTCSAA